MTIEIKIFGVTFTEKSSTPGSISINHLLKCNDYFVLGLAERNGWVVKSIAPHRPMGFLFDQTIILYAKSREIYFRLAQFCKDIYGPHSIKTYIFPFLLTPCKLESQLTH